MAVEKNLSFIFKQAPAGFPVAGEHVTVEDRGYDPSAPPPAGGVVTQNLYASFDPYMRGVMNPPKGHFATAYAPNQPIPSYCVSRVLRSDHEAYREGDVFVAPGIPVQQYSSLSAETVDKGEKIDPAATGLEDIRIYLGPLGMPGLTAYSSLYEIGKPRKAEVIFISSAAGAVGQLVGQLAKHEGLTVVGSAGSDEKIRLITEELGFDHGFNYKREKALDALTRLCPDGIDIYYDNVGGEQLEAALEMLNNDGRIVGCGMVSQYNVAENERYGVKNLHHMVWKHLTFRGFLVYRPDFGPKWGTEHRKNLSRWIADRSLKVIFSETDGIEKAAEGFVGMLKGENFGKAVLKI